MFDFSGYWDTVLRFSGGKWSIVLFLAAVVILVVLRGKMPFAGKLLAFVLALSAVLYHPAAVAFLGKVLKDHLYWRMFWIAPAVPVFAYVLTELLASKDRKKTGLGLVLGISLLLGNGKCIYDPSLQVFEAAENPLKMPKNSYLLAQFLTEHYETVKAVVPDEIYPLIREYSAGIRLLYGRNIDGFISPVRSKRIRKLHGLMLEEPYQVKSIMKRAKKRGCDTVILRADWEKDGNPEDYGFVPVYELQKYTVYHLEG